MNTSSQPKEPAAASESSGQLHSSQGGESLNKPGNKSALAPQADSSAASGSYYQVLDRPKDPAAESNGQSNAKLLKSAGSQSRTIFTRPPQLSLSPKDQVINQLRQHLEGAIPLKPVSPPTRMDSSASSGSNYQAPVLSANRASTLKKKPEELPRSSVSMNIEPGDRITTSVLFRLKDTRSSNAPGPTPGEQAPMEPTPPLVQPAEPHETSGKPDEIVVDKQDNQKVLQKSTVSTGALASAESNHGPSAQKEAAQSESMNQKSMLEGSGNMARLSSSGGTKLLSTNSSGASEQYQYREPAARAKNQRGGGTHSSDKGTQDRLSTSNPYTLLKRNLSEAAHDYMRMEYPGGRRQQSAASSPNSADSAAEACYISPVSSRAIAALLGKVIEVSINFCASTAALPPGTFMPEILHENGPSHSRAYDLLLHRIDEATHEYVQMAFKSPNGQLRVRSPMTPLEGHRRSVELVLSPGTKIAINTLVSKLINATKSFVTTEGPVPLLEFEEFMDKLEYRPWPSEAGGKSEDYYGLTVRDYDYAKNNEQTKGLNRDWNSGASFVEHVSPDTRRQSSLPGNNEWRVKESVVDQVLQTPIMKTFMSGTKASMPDNGIAAEPVQPSLQSTQAPPGPTAEPSKSSLESAQAATESTRTQNTPDQQVNDSMHKLKDQIAEITLKISQLVESLPGLLSLEQLKQMNKLRRQKYELIYNSLKATNTGSRLHTHRFTRMPEMDVCVHYNLGTKLDECKSLTNASLPLADFTSSMEGGVDLWPPKRRHSEDFQESQNLKKARIEAAKAQTKLYTTV